MWRFALSRRRWWAGHVLVVLCCALFLRLGRWQWDRGLSPTGDWQNLGYALQWPVFAVVLVAAWVRFLWLEQHRDPAPGDPVPGDPAPRGPAPNPNPTWPAARRQPHRPIPEDDPDDELVAYNAYLARLAERNRRS